MKYFFLFIFLFFSLGTALGDEEFDLEDDAPKKEVKKTEVNEESLKELLLSGQYSKLSEAFKDLKNNAPDKFSLPAVRKIYLQFQIETGLYKKALEDLEKNPLKGDAWSIYLTSEVYRLLGLYKKAQQIVDEGLKTSPESAVLLSAGDNLALLLGDTAKASQFWTKIKKLIFKTKKGKEATAEQATFFGRSAKSRYAQLGFTLFLRANRHDEKYIQAHIGAGNHCADKYQWNYAIESLKKALEINSNHPQANAGLAKVLMEKGDYAKARELIETALEVNPSCSEAIRLKIVVLMADEQEKKALALMKKALETNPNDLEILSELAAAYEQAGDTAKRDETLKKVLAINPTYSRVYLAIAQSCENRRQFPQAVTWSRKAMELNQRDWEGYYIAGMNLLRLGEEKEGYEILDKAFKYNSFNKWARNILTLLDRDFKYKEYDQFETEHFVIKLHRSESNVMAPYLKTVVEDAYEKYTKKYEIEPVGPKEYGGKILLLMFRSHNDFSARTVGLPGLGALGACFGQIITMPSPIIGKNSDERKFNWKRVFEHEFIHVLTLQKSSYHVPRWFTEGISTWEEDDPQSEVDFQLKWAWKNKKLLPLEDINTGFSQQEYPNQIGVSYYHASLVCKYINDKYGFKAILKMLELYRAGKSNEEAIEGGVGKKLSEINREVKAYVDAFISDIPLSIPMDEETMTQLENTMNNFGIPIERKIDLASAWAQVGDFDKAVKAIGEVLKSSPGNIRAIALNGFIHYRRGNKDAAKESFEKVVEKEKLHYGANYYLGKIAEEKENFAKAVEFYESAMKKYPRVSTPGENLYYKVVSFYDELGDKEKALQTLKEHTLRNNKDFEGFVRYADRLREEEKTDLAIKAYMGASYIFPYDFEVHVNCGNLLFKAKRYKEAARELAVALEIEPRDKAALEKVFETYILLNDKKSAGKALKKLTRFFPDDDFSALEKKLSSQK